jgi:RNA polymerase sigma-70 factor (ECF subfamily)
MAGYGADPAGPHRFATTRWSIVVAAGAAEDTVGRAALESLCAAYWYPLYAFERRGGTAAEDARDLVQGFFAELLEKDYLAQADRERGRFRTFLITAFRHFASKEREKARALKRGGGRRPLPLDFEDGESRYLREPADERTPERLFERRWALTLLDEAMARLLEEHRAAGREALFDALRGTLGGAGAGPEEPYAALGARLGMSEGALKVAVHRLRRRYRDVLRAAIAETVADPAEVDDEIRQLLGALTG